MKKPWIILVACFLSVAAAAEHHSSAEAELREAVIAFNVAYANNTVDDYIDFYADGATVFWYGARQDIAAYHVEWSAMIAAGGGVEKNDMSDLRVQILASGDVAVTTYFVDNRTRSADGEVESIRAFETDVWQKIDGAWKVVSLHYSLLLPE
jgi:ketosteroid isomerase-like protein